MKKTRLYMLLMSLMLIFWNLAIFRPVKVVSMFIHEVGHYVMTFLLDRRVAVFDITLNEIGHSSRMASGWLSSFIIANGGYIMSLFFAILILRANGKNVKRYVLGVLSCLILVSLMYIKDTPVSFLYLIIFLIMVVALYMLNNDSFFEYAIDIIGVSNIVYCIYETLMKEILPSVVDKFGILKNLLVSSRVTTDSEVLYKLTGIPVFVWGIFWFLVSLIVMVFCMNVKRKRKY